MKALDIDKQETLYQTLSDTVNESEWSEQNRCLNESSILACLDPLPDRAYRNTEVNQFDSPCLWREFIRETTVQVDNPHDYITWKDPGHNLSLGHVGDDLTFKVGMGVWLEYKRLGRLASKFEWDPKSRQEVANEFGFDVREVVIRKLDGILLKRKYSAAQVPNITFFCWNMIDVLSHVLILWSIPIFLIIRANQMQYTWAQTIAPITGGEPFYWYHLFKHGNNPFSFDDKRILPLVFVVAWTVSIYFVLISLRMLFHYLEFSSIGFSSMIIRYVFCNFLKAFGMCSRYGSTFKRSESVCATAIAFFGYLALACVWVVLAAVISPEDYMVYGVAGACRFLV